MPRLNDSRTLLLLNDVPANFFRLVKEALSLRQKIVVLKQTTHFLQRCLQHRAIPNFIKKKKLHEVCGLPVDSRQIQELQLRILRTALRSKRNQLFSSLNKCMSKDLCCERYLPVCHWKKIVGESKTICDSIRSNFKRRLQNKFSRLVELEGCRDSQCQVSTSNSVDHPQTDSSGESESIPPRVTVIGGINLSEDALSVLDLGPSFAQVRSVGREVPRRVLCGLQALQDNLRRNAKLRENPRERLAGPNFPAIPFPSLYFRPQDPNPTVDVKFRLFATSVYEILRRNIHRRPTSNLTASQKRGLNELIDLVNSKTIKISVSDKGGEFVVMPRSLDIAITESHLQDVSLYRPSSENEYKRQYRRLNRVWSDIARTADLPKTVSTRLRCDLPVCPVLYVLIKTHKLPPNSQSSLNPLDFKVRPIISSVGGPTDRISWLLNLVLTQLLTFIPAHLSNTMKFLDQLRETLFRRNHVIESFDVTSLYTNVSNGDAMQATHELLNTHAGSINMYGLTVSQVMTLVKECLDCSIFRWSGRYFKQVRGLAMGQRLAPVLAIAYMSKIEKPVLDRRPVLYCRYVDDCFVACSTQKEMDKCFELLNSQADNIRFAREKPNDKWLPFLNMQVQLERGFLRTKWYRKPTSKNILVHFRSAHPRKIKRAITANMIRTAKMVSSGGQEQVESVELAKKVALFNGYPLREWHYGRPPQRKPHEPRCENSEKVPFCLPFVSDSVSLDVRMTLRKCGLDDTVRVVEVPPRNLKQRLVQNRLYDRFCTTPHCIICSNGRGGDCMTSGVIYVITCNLCGDEYIGETGRPLICRVKEHLDGLKKSRPKTPLGDHRRHHHEDIEFGVSIRVLMREPTTSARKILEAFWINAKNLKMNRKEECLAVTNELAPFLDLCGFQLPPASEVGVRTLGPTHCD
uniref:Reverse transcriptase domain-containing protein n=1 Tax=Haemonchus contortus TaxID=6289 RepID=A0A7I4XWM4_HAECO